MALSDFTAALACEGFGKTTIAEGYMMTMPVLGVSIQPTEEMIEAGINQLLEELPGIEDEVEHDQLSDTVTFIWQAMLAAR
ncbi:hypothetical protein [Serratia liquefaciens]|uniref:hypothetical protein n=1 Tax=Serratia liquefaciens TaxID=614 RepID=UPI00061B84E6|nr:hypothetical protein [Serratia liquefaciens]AKE09179.1 hypothetical protein XJ20_04465 [Serratia liquefaciens]